MRVCPRGKLCLPVLDEDNKYDLPNCEPPGTGTTCWAAKSRVTAASLIFSNLGTADTEDVRSVNTAAAGRHNLGEYILALDWFAEGEDADLGFT